MLPCHGYVTNKLRYLGQGSNTYPSAASTYLLGACTGSFAAAAISTSQTLAELLPPAVEAVLVAFRCALRAFIFRDDIEASVSSGQKSWTALVRIQRSEADKLIKDFNDKVIHTSRVLSISSSTIQEF